MRISDWSSDVCSSDLPSGRALSDGGLSPSSNNHDRLESAMFARPRVALRALIVFILATVVSTAPAHAQSWAESWFDNVTYTSPGSFEDQTRGYVTAGGMSGRVDVHNDSLMSVRDRKSKRLNSSH